MATLNDIVAGISSDYKNTQALLNNAAMLNALTSATTDEVLQHCGGSEFKTWEITDDITVDTVSDEQIRMASLTWSTLLKRTFGTYYGTLVYKRMAQKIYMVGLHKASSGTSWYVRPGPEEKDYSEEQKAAKDAYDALSADDRANPANSEVVKRFEYLHRGIKAQEVKKAYHDFLRDVVSKTMLLRIYALPLKHIHETRLTHGKRNVFTYSCSKYDIPLDENSVPDEWMYFGADHHPQFQSLPEGQRSDYKALKKAIFAQAKAEEAAGGGANEGI